MSDDKIKEFVKDEGRSFWQSSSTAFMSYAGFSSQNERGLAVARQAGQVWVGACCPWVDT